jgi:hypothetical protein
MNGRIPSFYGLLIFRVAAGNKKHTKKSNSVAPQYCLDAKLIGKVPSRTLEHA